MKYLDDLHKDKKIQRAFLQNQIQYIANLRNQSKRLEKYGFIHSIPLVTGKSDNQEYKRVYETLMKAIKGMVLNYSNDAALQKIIPLSPKTREILDQCPQDYNLGSLRPDFIVDDNNKFYINEINARFSTNGFFLSYLMNRALMDISKKNKGMPILDLEKVPEAFSKAHGNIGILKLEEPNWDIGLFAEYKAKRGSRCSTLSPENFDPKNLDSLVLELKQREIENLLNLDKIREIQKLPHFNDLRTILIAHDKRLMQALYDPKILSSYLHPQEMKILAPHLLETHACNNEVLEKAKKEKDNWVLKPALKGKCQQLSIGPDLEQRVWENACEQAKSEPFVIQKCVEPKQFSIYIPHLGEVKMPLYGMLLGFDGKFISQGAYKGRTIDPTKIWNGGVFVPPALE